MQNIKRLIQINRCPFKNYIKYTRTRRTFSRRRRRAPGYVNLNSSLYRDAEGSSELRLCLRDAISNAAPKIGGGVINWNCIDSLHLEE